MTGRECMNMKRILTSYRTLLVWLFALAGIASCGGGGGGLIPHSSAGAVSGTVTVQAGTLQSLTAALVPPHASGLRQVRSLPAYVPHRVVVRFWPGAVTQDADALHRAAGGHVIGVIPQLGIHVVQLGPGVTSQAALAAYRTSPLVQYAEQDAYAYALATPNDPYYPIQWHYPKIGLPAAWDVTTGGPVIVAVVDTGIRFDHPDLAGVTVPGYDFIDNDQDPTDPGCPTVDPGAPSHGTHVAGTIAALTNNGTGVAGVTWGGVAAVRIMPVRVLGEDVPGNQCGTGFLSAVAAGIVYATDHGAKVINLSLGGPTGTQALQDAVNYALGRGVTLLAAAGNENGPVAYPAAYPGVIAVAATACDDQRASYSNFGPQIWVAAPGGDANANCPAGQPQASIWSTSWSPTKGNGYFGFRGTSMATAHVSGVAALLIFRGVTTPEAIRDRLRSTAVDRGAPGWDPYFGYGLVNAAAAVGASNPNSSMRAFSGVISGNTITPNSDFASVAATGSFTIASAQPGTWSVFSWQDFNSNGVVDSGDFYGRVDGVAVSPGTVTSGVVVPVRLYTGSPLSVYAATHGR